MAAGDEAKGRRAVQFICGTPRQFCSGRSVGDKREWAYGKVHGDIASCKSCQANYLAKQGYTKIGSNTFDPGNGDPILVMSKRPARAKPGKTKNGYMAMPLKVRDITPMPK